MFFSLHLNIGMLKKKEKRSSSCGHLSKIITKSITRIKESTRSSSSEDIIDDPEKKKKQSSETPPSKKESDPKCLTTTKALSTTNSKNSNENKKHRKSVQKKQKKKQKSSSNSKDKDNPEIEKKYDSKSKIIDIDKSSESSDDLIAKLNDEIKKKDQKIISQTRVIKELEEKNAFQKEEINQLHENIENKYKNHKLENSNNIQIYGIQIFNKLNKKKIE